MDFRQNQTNWEVTRENQEPWTFTATKTLLCDLERPKNGVEQFSESQSGEQSLPSNKC